MSSKSFRPMSRQEAERFITREQRDFSAGVFKDIPGTSIPDNGIAELKNFINKGSELVSRSGSKRWGDYSTGVPHAALPTIVDDILIVSLVANADNRTVTTSGYVWSEDNIGDFIVYENGINEKIINFIDENNVVTQISTDETILDIGTISIRKQLNGIYFHNSLKKIVIQLGSDIYVSSDIFISEWKKAICESTETLENSISTIDEYNDYLLIFNQGGIYRLDLNINVNETYFYYKINSLIPQDKLTGVDKTGASTYCRRYIYGLGKISGVGQNRDRLTNGCRLLIDSGTNTPDSNYIDYSEYWMDDAISPSNGNTIGNLTIPNIDGPAGEVKEKHWDVFTIWGTTDVSEVGLNKTDGTATNPSRYIWIADVPVCKALEVSFDGTACTVIRGGLSKYDVGSTINAHYGDISYDAVIVSVDEENNTCVIADSLPYVEKTCVSLGAAHCDYFNYDDTVGGFTLSTDHSGINNISVGDKIFLDNGVYMYVSEILDNHVYFAEDIELDDTYITGCWKPTSRSFNDTITDDLLRSRITSYTCYQRLYEGLPNCNIGVISSGFVFTALRDDRNIYYSQLTEQYDYISGYYHPYHQQFITKDGIRFLKLLRDKLVIYGFNSTRYILMSSYDELDLSDIGIVVPILTQNISVDDNIGVVAYGSIRSLENGDHIMITNEPALRVFDGNIFSENLASKKMMNELKRMQPNMSSIYDPIIGYIFWGLNA